MLELVEGVDAKMDGMRLQVEELVCQVQQTKEKEVLVQERMMAMEEGCKERVGGTRNGEEVVEDAAARFSTVDSMVWKLTWFRYGPSGLIRKVVHP